MFSFTPQNYSKRLLPIISWSHWFTFFNIILAIVLSSAYLFNEAKPETLIGNIYGITNWISHIGFLTFISFVLILFPIILIFPNTRFIRATASIVFTIELLLLLLDAYIYNRLGYHLNASSSTQIIEVIRQLIAYKAALFWSVIAVASMLILAFELVVSNYAWKHLRSLQQTVFSRYIIIVLVISFFTSHLIHIYADANLKYDVLKQDTLLPLSYPSTAKTLLTKYGMFDQKDYIERRTSPLAFTNIVPQYPILNQQCTADKTLSRSTFLVITKEEISKQQQLQFIERSKQNSLKFNRHIDNALPNNAWFNLFYSLPTIYQNELLKQQIKPLLFQQLEQLNAVNTITEIGAIAENNLEKKWFSAWFEQYEQLSDISSLVFAEKLNNFPAGLHLIYFNESSSYQFELFMDALLLAQNQKQEKDIIWVSSIGNQNINNILTFKPALLVLPNYKTKTIKHLTSNMDLQPTLMNRWLNCDIDAKTYSNGTDMALIRDNRVLANTVDKGIVVFNKDKSMLIDQNGHFQSYSTQLEAPIMVNPDFPLMIDAVHFIKQFGEQGKPEL